MLIHKIRLQNLLSFGPESDWLEMKPLNVLIGPNAAGKSNLVEAIGLLQAAPKDLPGPIRKGGGVGEWIWKGEPKSSSASVDVILKNQKESPEIHYGFAFEEKGQRFEVTDERIETEKPYGDHEKPYLYFGYQNGSPYLNYNQEGEQRKLQREEINPEQSILEQRRDPDHYPELTYVGDMFGRIRLYREWSFGRRTPPRLPQPADLLVDFLSEDCSNLGLVLSQMKQNPKVKESLLDALRELYEGVTDFEVSIFSGTVQVVMQEEGINNPIPATRLSDGTLRYLCLLAILCHPNPPPLICIEEPELGLHPDILPTLGKLLIEASERCQLIVTTHSDMLVDMMSDTPENVVVCEKHEGKTSMRRLNKEDLDVWLKDYGLGQLWTEGELGGNRW